MLKIVNNSFKKKIAIFACVAFISLSFPGAAQTATKSSSSKDPFSLEFLSLFSAATALVPLNFPPGIYDLATSYNLTTQNETPIYVLGKGNKKKKKGTNNKSKDSNDAYKSHGNSTSKKKANGKD